MLLHVILVLDHLLRISWLIKSELMQYSVVIFRQMSTSRLEIDFVLAIAHGCLIFLMLVLKLQFQVRSGSKLVSEDPLVDFEV